MEINEEGCSVASLLCEELKIPVALSIYGNPPWLLLEECQRFLSIPEKELARVQKKNQSMFSTCPEGVLVADQQVLAFAFSSTTPWADAIRKAVYSVMMKLAQGGTATKADLVEENEALHQELSSINASLEREEDLAASLQADLDELTVEHHMVLQQKIKLEQRLERLRNETLEVERQQEILHQKVLAFPKKVSVYVDDIPPTVGDIVEISFKKTVDYPYLWGVVRCEKESDLYYEESDGKKFASLTSLQASVY